MAVRDGDRWAAAFRRLHRDLLGDLDATDALDRSRARVRDAREALARTAPRPRPRPFAALATAPPSEADDDGPGYFALILDDRGALIARQLLARDDDQAVDRAWVAADARPFEVWDGRRFVERFAPAAGGDADRRGPAGPDGGAVGGG